MYINFLFNMTSECILDGSSAHILENTSSMRVGPLYILLIHVTFAYSSMWPTAGVLQICAY